MNLKNLHAPFPPNEIEWRVGSTSKAKDKGLALAYLTARHVMERLDEVCGTENWQDRYEFHGKRTVCYLSIRVGDEWVTKADGAGDSDVEAEKGAISDALKRAAVKWGIGRYLYALGNTWVELESAGNSYRIKATEFGRLESILNKRFGVPPSDMGNVNDAPVEIDPPAPPPSQPKGERLNATDPAAAKLFSRLQGEMRSAAGESLVKLGEVWKRNQVDLKRLPEKLELDLVDLKESLKQAALVHA